MPPGWARSKVSRNAADTAWLQGRARVYAQYRHSSRLPWLDANSAPGRDTNDHQTNRLLVVAVAGLGDDNHRQRVRQI